AVAPPELEVARPVEAVVDEELHVAVKELLGHARLRAATVTREGTPVDPAARLPGGVEEAKAAGARRRQAGQEAIPRHAAGAEPRHVRGHHLDVEPVEAARA